MFWFRKKETDGKSVKDEFDYDESLLPNSDLAVYVGSSTTEDFKRIGIKAVRQLETLGELRRTDDVLEAGCGIGRIAIPLAHWLTDGSYQGFDIVRHGIEWCQTKITAKFPNFQFQWVDIYNKTYNPNGQYQATDFRFPYSDEAFDFIFLTSVFTHMLPLDFQHYLSEINRTLKNNGTCFFTTFLINDDVLQRLSTSKRPFHHVGDYWTLNPDSHEDGLAYDQALVEQWVRSQGFVISKIQYSHWWATGAGQDIMVIKKYCD
jgi:SAM-dependent methyltransferase